MEKISDLVVPDLFKAEDFRHLLYPLRDDVKNLAAEYANARFRAWAEGLQPLYGTRPNQSHNAWNDFETSAVNTHVALLAFPQEIKRQECEHEPNGGFHFMEKEMLSVCAKCKAKLKARWEKIDE